MSTIAIGHFKGILANTERNVICFKKNNFNSFRKIYIIKGIGKMINITGKILHVIHPKQKPPSRNVFIAGTQFLNRRFRLNIVDGITLQDSLP